MEEWGSLLSSGKGVRIFLRINPQKIYWLRFILEGYGHLGLVRTRDVHRGEVEILVSRDTYWQVMEIISGLASQLHLKEAP
ncbi:DUF4911 domain-containing protein [Thermosulfuriphilus ammonigenes]|uniref:DUF4911 domain-containing protein n=1 Tax=Thermosulfuriphilus ammonigenes TaxID=1936021 RepID=A0A6G7PTY5_9BACT|nr:DUF4911 domain-containing protein [Thermosulfuriphilus ammonigenes]MBA2848757.1 Na+-transporting NADH:ubiquinone oxidoreductase subunit NqrB [Thermosulfuriphilus ammonigenes]QIJ71112.1 DUF4911 domain-containing protein [Thermosulfuriphilus ammonigenes]